MNKISIFIVILFVSFAAAADAKDNGRKFYLTKTFFDGDEALTSCADGYHMASIWEILDPSNLRYNRTLGITLGDSGFGPPTGSDGQGWIRTGNSGTGSAGAGFANCMAYTSDNSGDRGTFAGLPTSWDFSDGDPTEPWDSADVACDTNLPVWCIED